MAISSKHPDYAENVPDWKLLRDSWAGERTIKEATTTYLPATPGQVFDGLEVGQVGHKNYKSYLARARFHDFVTQAIEKLVGIMHHKPPTIELPKALDELMDRATVQNEPLATLLRRINAEQLAVGRLGLLADVPNDSLPGVIPYIALYKAEDIINWDDGRREEIVLQNLNLVVLDESEAVRVDQFEWEDKEKHRVLILGAVDANEPETAEAVYRVGVFTEEDGGDDFDEARLVEPSIAGKKLSQLPFIFINSKDIIPDPDRPPLLGLARLGLTVYRGEADYRQTLFLQGQDTLVVTGGAGVVDDDETRVGAGATLEVPIGGDAKYIGVSADGLSEQRESLQNDKSEANDLGGSLLDTRGKEAESGDALRIRVSARTASIVQIAKAGAEGLKEILKIMATWVGADPEEVVVEANLDFADDSLEGRTLVEIMTAKTMGAPISLESIHRLMREKDMTEKEFEEEMALIESEAPEPEGEGILGDAENVEIIEQPGTGQEVLDASAGTSSDATT